MTDNNWKTSCHHMSTCALTGASAFFASIPGSFVLVNGPLWCYFYAMKYVEDYDASALRRFHCTQPEGNALVYGTEKDLLAGLDFIKSNFAPERVFILNNCSVSLVGDDIAGIAAKAELPWPAYAVDCGGIAGDFSEGYEIALLRVIDEVKKNAKDTIGLPSLNLLGLSPTYFRGEEDIKEIHRILEKAGYRINAIPGGSSTWDEIMELPKAELNIV